MSDFTREIRIVKGYDYRDDPNDQRGAHGMEVRFILRGPLGAITWNLGTGIMHRPLLGGYVRGAGKQRRADKPGLDPGVRDYFPSAGAISGHAPERRRDYWHGPSECDALPGGTCYGDTGYLVGDDALDALVLNGEDGLFAFLTEIHDDWLSTEDLLRLRDVIDRAEGLA